MYHGTTATHDCFPERFDSNACATLLSLVTSYEHLTPYGATPGALSSLDVLPLTVEIYHSVPFLSPFYMGHLDPVTHLTSLEPGLSLPLRGLTPPTSTWRSIYQHGYSPLH